MDSEIILIVRVACGVWLLLKVGIEKRGVIYATAVEKLRTECIVPVRNSSCVLTLVGAYIHSPPGARRTVN
eukprot:scaffold313917_cov48-Tisochrysis_lutea.AAC.1